MQREKLVPINDCVLVREDAYEPYEKLKGYTKIITPDKFQHGPEDRPVRGEVVNVGPECKGMVRRGDRVIFGKFAGARFEVNKKFYMLVREYELLAKEQK